MKKHKRILIATAGTFLEWTEFSYYAYLSSMISRLFFSLLNPFLGLMAAFSVFAIGYIFRPLGSIFFGHVGDKYGRRKALQQSIFLMGISSLGLAVIPTYSHAGIYAPLLLIFFRCLQGFAVAGEFNGSAIYLIEHDEHRPCLASSWTAFAAASGMMAGSFMAYLVQLSFMPEWAWRLPFLLGASACFFARLLRGAFPESPEFINQDRADRSAPLKILFSKHRTLFYQSILIVSALGVYLYTMNIYYANHLSRYSTLTQNQIRLVISTAQLMVTIFIPLIALTADRFNTKNLLISGLLSAFISVPLLYVYSSSLSFSAILFLQIPYALTNVLISIPLFNFLNQIFPTSIRYSGISISWSISMALFGGTAPLVAGFLQQKTGLASSPAVYVLIMIIVSLIIVKNVQRRSTIQRTTTVSI